MARLIPVLYEDDVSIAFDKPPGILSVPGDKPTGAQTLVDLVNQQPHPQYSLHPAHRLDRDTSGTILFAKGKANQRLLMDAFKEKRVGKQYVAFVHGHVKPREGKITIPIKDIYQRKFSRGTPAQEALTHYRVKNYHKDFTVVDVMPVTGRTNQIRIHFAQIGHPIVGEDKYAFRKDFVLKFRRTALHAAVLEWLHPVTRAKAVARAPLPADMEKFLKEHQ